MKRVHAMPFGATLGDGGVRFRLWAPLAEAVTLLIETPPPGRSLAMARGDGGWFETWVRGTGAGTRYRFSVDGGIAVPDPASRFQPEDVHGPSEVIDPAAYLWKDADWPNRPWEETVVYELHLGAFTEAGTYAATAARLPHLVELGVTAVELMPVADTPGARNWGYDGVALFAPDSRHGRPEELKALIDAAHAHGLMVLLDVVYNHFGPEGNYLHLIAPPFFTERVRTPWGAAIDFEGPWSRTVRDFFIENALYWLEEYHFDGLRLDAVHAIHDRSEPDIVTEIAEAVRARLPGRTVHLVLENDDNRARYLERDGTGRPRWYVAQWNDDAHHPLHVLLTGEEAGYYGDYAERPAAHLGRALAEGFAYQGEPSRHRGGRPRGEPSAHLPPTAFVPFLQNHDQIGNRAFGERLTTLAPAEGIEAALALLLLAPSPPLLFMGEEWGAEQPFPFFCDFGPELAQSVREGRRREFAQFPEFRDPAVRARIPDPNDPETFRRAILNWDDRLAPGHRERLALVRRLVALRHAEIVPRLARIGGHAGRYRAFGRSALEVAWRLGDGSRLEVVANLAAAPLSLAPPQAVLAPLFERPDGALAAWSQGGRLPPWSVIWRHGAPPEP